MFPTQEHIQAAQEAADYWKAKAGVYVWPSVTLAQAVIESANWTKLAGLNNGFGIKATDSQIAAGKATYLWTTEYRNGAPVKVKQWFASFASLTEAYREHARILATVRVYSPAWRAADPKAFIEAAGPHYATAPDYAQTIIGVMDRLALTQYDRPAVAASTPPQRSGAIVAGAAGAGGAIIATIGPHLSGIGVEAVAAVVVVALLAVAIHIFATQRPAPKVTPATTAAPPPAPIIPKAAPVPPAAAPAIEAVAAALEAAPAPAPAASSVHEPV